MVVLNSKAKPFDEPKHKKLRDRLKKTSIGGSLLTRTLPPSPPDDWPEDQKIAELLDVADDGIGDRLTAFEREQAIGYKLNELTEKYYKANPRNFDDDWPNERYSDDVKLRSFLTTHVDSEPKEIIRLAKQELKIELSKD